MKNWKIALSLYAALAIACFGKAVLDAGRQGEREVMECLKRANQDLNYCDLRDDVMWTKGVAQAIAWPLWLSYKIAEAASDE